MNTVTQFLAGLTNAHYILLYLCCFALAVLCVLIETKTKLKAISVLLPVFSLNGGMLATAFVTIKLDLNIGLGILVVWAVFSSIIIFPSLWIHKKISEKEVPEKPASIICSENGHQWEKTEIACTVRCARCGKTKVRHQFEILPDKHEKRCVFCGHTEAVPYKQRIISTETTESKDLLDCSKNEILAAVKNPDNRDKIPDLFCRYLEKKGSKTYSKGTAKAIMTCLTEDQVIELVKNKRIKGQYQWALAEISADTLLKKLCDIDEFSYVANGELLKRENQVKDSREKEYCPDGTPHEFGDELIETVDMGAKGDDDLAAHAYRKDRYRICKKCGYKLYMR